jgi:hypothetical protein
MTTYGFKANPIDLRNGIDSIPLGYEEMKVCNLGTSRVILKLILQI